MKQDSLKVQVYSQIKKKITNCEYAPGSMINEETLQKDIATSRTPIRDALSRLEQEGLVIIRPKKGILISPLTLKEMNMVFETRLLFEPFALLNYGYTLQENALYDFYRRHEQALATINEPQFFSLDDSFHKFIIMSLPNIYLKQCYDIISVQNIRFRILTGSCKESRLVATGQEHLKIIKACLKKDWKTASESMKDHLIQSKDAAFELLLDSKMP